MNGTRLTHTHWSSIYHILVQCRTTVALLWLYKWCDGILKDNNSVIIYFCTCQYW